MDIITSAGTVSMTPQVFQMIQLKAALKLESKGLKHSSGRSARAMVKRMEGAPKTNDYTKLIEFLEAKLSA